MSAPATMPPGKPIPDFASSTPSSSLWDRISNWASENKAVVYTIAGVAIVVTGAGVAYYLTDSVCLIEGVEMGGHELTANFAENYCRWSGRAIKEVKQREETTEEGGREEDQRS